MTFALTSCFNDMIEKIDSIEDVTWNPTLALPITHEELSIAEFSEDISGDNFSYRTTEDGLVVLTYSQDQVFSRTAEELIDINDENFSTAITLESGLATDLPVTGTVTQTETRSFTVSTPAGDKLFTASMKGGQMDISISGNFPASGEMVLTFNTIILDDSPLAVPFQWTYDGTNTQLFNRTVDLNGAEIDFTDNNSTYNHFGFSIDLTINYEGQPVASTMAMDLDVDLLSLEFSQATVNVAQRTLETRMDEIIFYAVNDLRAGYYYLDEPAVSFRFSNSFGVPIDVLVNNMTAHSNDNGDLPLTGDLLGAPVTLGYPDISEMGSSVETKVSVDHANSNLPDVVAWQPNSLSYEYQSTLNGAGSDDVHFVLDTSRISVDVAMELPMYGRFRNLTISENYEFDGSVFDEVDAALFRLRTVNGFPINAFVQCYFLDAGGNRIDSLLVDDQQLLLAGITDNEGKVTTPSEKAVEVFVEAGRLTAIAQAERIVLRAVLNTPDNDTRSVKIFEEDQLVLSLMVQTEFEISL